MSACLHYLLCSPAHVAYMDAAKYGLQRGDPTLRTPSTAGKSLPLRT